MKKIKIIIMLIVILTCIAIILFVISNNLSKVTEYEDSGKEAVIELDYKIEHVQDESVFFTIETMTQFVVNHIANNDSEFVYNVLNNDYKNKNQISKENVINKVLNVDGEKSFDAIEMYEVNGDASKVIYVYGTLQNLINDANDINKENTVSKLQYIYAIFNIDNKNSTYDFQIISEGEYKKLLAEGKKEDYKVTIQSNESNKILMQNWNDSMIAGKYLQKYKGLLLNNPEMAYNLLEDKYKKTRFPSVEKFKAYIEENRKTINELYLSKYVKIDKEKYKEYICNDKYNNYFIFKVNYAMGYNVLLDSYTVPTEEVKENYEKSNNEQKAAMNVQTFIEMINTKDYAAAYEVLADGFKQNYFKDEDTLKKFVQSAFFEYNKIKSVSAEKKDKYYVITVTIQDYKDLNKELKSINFIVNLKENMEFELSFGSN